MNRFWIVALVTLFLIPALCLTPLAYAEEHPEQPSGPTDQADTGDQALTPKSEEQDKQKAEPIEDSDIELKEPIESSDVDRKEPIKIPHVRLKDKINCFFLAVDESPTTLQLPNAALSLNRPEHFEVNWRFASLDNQTLGWQKLIGDVILPEGYVFAKEPLTVAVFVVVYDPAKPPIVEAEDVVYSINLAIGPITVPVGTNREELQQYFEDATETAYIYFHEPERGIVFECPLYLNLDAIHTDKPGVYYPFTYELPAAVSLNPQGMHTTKVYVLPDDAVSLIGVANAPGGYIVKWLYPAQHPIFWISVDDGQWEKIATDEYGIFQNGYGSALKDNDEIGVTALLLKTKSSIPSGHVYRFQIQYESDRFSDVLIMDLTNVKDIKLSNDVGGDRDGGDRGEAELPAPSASKGTSGKKSKVKISEDLAILLPAITPMPVPNETSALPSAEIDMAMPAATATATPDGQMGTAQPSDRPIISETRQNSTDEQKAAAITSSDTVTGSALPDTAPLLETEQRADHSVSDTSFVTGMEDPDLPSEAGTFIPLALVGGISFIAAVSGYVFLRKQR